MNILSVEFHYFKCTNRIQIEHHLGVTVTILNFEKEFFVRWYSRTDRNEHLMREK